MDPWVKPTSTRHTCCNMSRENACPLEHTEVVDQLWEYVAFGLASALAGAAFPAALAWRQQAEKDTLRARLSAEREAREAAERDNARLRKEVFHTTATRRLPWPWPPPLPDPDREPQ